MTSGNLGISEQQVFIGQSLKQYTRFSETCQVNGSDGSCTTDSSRSISQEISRLREAIELENNIRLKKYANLCCQITGGILPQCYGETLLLHHTAKMRDFIVEMSYGTVVLKSRSSFRCEIQMARLSTQK